MSEQYRVMCQGYEGKDKRIEPHPFYRDTPIYEGSHSICPECFKLFKQDIAAAKSELEKKVRKE